MTFGRQRSLRVVANVMFDRAHDFLLPFPSSYDSTGYFVSFPTYSQALVENRDIYIPNVYSTPPGALGGDSVGISQRCLVLRETRMIGLPYGEERMVIHVLGNLLTSSPWIILLSEHL